MKKRRVKYQLPTRIPLNVRRCYQKIHTDIDYYYDKLWFFRYEEIVLSYELRKELDGKTERLKKELTSFAETMNQIVEIYSKYTLENKESTT